jgi:hypothetical protein
MLLLPEGQTGDSWEIQNGILFHKSGNLEYTGTLCTFVSKGVTQHNSSQHQVRQ